MQPYGPYRHMPLNTTTLWERASVSAETAKFLQGKYTLWSRLMNGEHFWACVPNGVEPINGSELGYHGIAEALKSKGLL